MRLSPQQEAAVKAVSEWLRAPGGRQHFYLAGYAGTGKTTLARHFAEGIDGEVAFAAFTGKAALVMRSKGCKGASTIHSLIYRLEDETAGTPKFVLNRDSPVGKADLVVIDEVSMVGEDLARDLLSFGTKVLVLGDPAQLPPVNGTGYFTADAPDVMLTDVHRQARDNPIIRMSMEVREGGRLAAGAYGESRVVRRAELDGADVAAADQVLVGTNRTRHLFNRRLRELRGFAGDAPAVGERLVCLRNNRAKGLLNGAIWSVAEVTARPDGILRLALEPEDAGARRRRVEVYVHPAHFRAGEGEAPPMRSSLLDDLTFGYALTVHKAQGSQWDRVVLFDESWAFREDRARWLYTGITRAAAALTVVV
jgi:exodeoxyribonuclease-5